MFRSAEAASWVMLGGASMRRADASDTAGRTSSP
jgi:hypothetical protein